MNMLDHGVVAFQKRKMSRTHRMSRWGSEVRAPSGTPRFYGVRKCKKCGAEEWKHPAGHFIDEDLLRKCMG